MEDEDMKEVVLYGIKLSELDERILWQIVRIFREESGMEFGENVKSMFKEIAPTIKMGWKYTLNIFPFIFVIGKDRLFLRKGSYDEYEYVLYFDVRTLIRDKEDTHRTYLTVKERAEKMTESINEYLKAFNTPLKYSKD